MIPIDETFVDSAAPNAGAISKGKGLARKGKLVVLNKDADDTIIFGECKGSGKSNYATSVDFTDPTNPTYRCSCPSRQFPCKHALGLMYAWAYGQTFVVADVPDDVATKRAKAVERVAKRKERAAKPKKVNKKALAKKIDAQLEGLDVLERMTHDLVRSGLGALNPKTARTLEEKAKELGNAFLPGAQNALRSLTTLFADADDNVHERGDRRREAIYTEALDRLTRLQMIGQRGRAYLEARKADPELTPDTESTIAAWLGHAWQLSELRQHGLFEKKAELVQLYFRSYDDPARQEMVDVGAWLNLKSGQIQLTKNYRPYRAATFIKEDDCFFHVKQVETLYRYPGDENPRVRWDGSTHRSLTAADVAAVRGRAGRSLPAVVKRIKNQLKDPLASNHPYALVAYRRFGRVGEAVVLEDADGERIELRDDRRVDPFATCLLYTSPSPRD